MSVETQTAQDFARIHALLLAESRTARDPIQVLIFALIATIVLQLAAFYAEWKASKAPLPAAPAAIRPRRVRTRPRQTPIHHPRSVQRPAQHATTPARHIMSTAPPWRKNGLCRHHFAAPMLLRYRN
jgi:hypothetical protein